MLDEFGRWAVDGLSNQSTGYCLDVSSWPAVAEALGQAGIVRPPSFTREVVFRRCPACRQLNIVREEDFVRVFCDEALPGEWNVDRPGRQAVGSFLHGHAVYVEPNV
ncbi:MULTISPECIES: hypothetical protein [unclassified Streptomyces]|uniref:hypothetical protein n=1 Tax=unclassified Streptomyces TaxID=2593676 RepID=UPI003867026D